jgi:hypothetical protein
VIAIDKTGKVLVNNLVKFYCARQILPPMEEAKIKRFPIVNPTLLPEVRPEQTHSAVGKKYVILREIALREYGFRPKSKQTPRLFGAHQGYD